MFGAEWKHQIDLSMRQWPKIVQQHSDPSTLAIEVLGMHDTHSVFASSGTCDHGRWVPAQRRCSCYYIVPHFGGTSRRWGKSW